MSCRVPFHRNLYVIGTLARRVSFATQQRRAFNLAYAIHLDLIASGDDAGVANKNVAIIGAGLAGLTANLAFAALNAAVRVYDEKGKEMEHLTDASHRFIHPSLNFWPSEPLEASTHFPGMNWIMDDCEAVKTQVIKDSETLRRTSDVLRQRLLKPFFSRRVDRIVSNLDNPETYKLMQFTQPGDTTSALLPIAYPSLVSGASRTDFEIVVVATGFGRDGATDPGSPDPNNPRYLTPPYWVRETDVIAQNQSLTDYDNIVISGTGDGGLVELIRVLWGDFKDNDVFTEALRAMLDFQSLQHGIKRIESDAAKKYFDSQLHTSSGPDMNAVMAEIELRLSEHYLTVVADVLANTPIGEDLLAAHVSWKGRACAGITPPIALIGKKPTPFELGTAPLHKVLIAFAYHHQLFRYVPVETWDFEPAQGIDDVYGGAIPRPFPQTVTITRPGDTNSFSLERSLLFQRHGAHRDLSIFEELPQFGSLIERIQRLQLMYADTDWLDPTTFDNYMECFYASVANAADKHTAHYESIADTFFREYYHHGIYRKDGRFVAYKPSGSALRTEPTRRALPISLMPSKVPSHFFAIQVVSGPPPPELQPI